MSDRMLLLVGFCPWRKRGCQGVFEYWRRDKVRSCPNPACRRAYYRAKRARKPENVERAAHLTSNWHQQEMLDRRLQKIPVDKQERAKARFLARFIGRCTIRMSGCHDVVFLFRTRKRLSVCANPRCQNRYWTRRARAKRESVLREMDSL